MITTERTRFTIKGKRTTAEIFFLKEAYLVQGTKIQIIKGTKLTNTTTEKLKEAIIEHQGKEVRIDHTVFETLQKMFGEFELVY